MRYIKKSFKIVLMLFILYIGYGVIYGNFHKIDSSAYRSAQLFWFNMPYYLDRYGIKTVINLRGEQQNRWWYRDEVKIVKERNITLIDYQLSSKRYLNPKEVQKLVEILRDVEKPILIHCEGGADRTSLVSAIYKYSILKRSLEEAKDELSFIYGHLPLLRPEVKAMDRSFKDFVTFRLSK